jgi:hypothetical protein
LRYEVDAISTGATVVRLGLRARDRRRLHEGSRGIHPPGRRGLQGRRAAPRSQARDDPPYVVESPARQLRKRLPKRLYLPGESHERHHGPRTGPLHRGVRLVPAHRSRGAMTAEPSLYTAG